MEEIQHKIHFLISLCISQGISYSVNSHLQLSGPRILRHDFAICEEGWKLCDSFHAMCNLPLISSLSSNVALKAPTGARRAFLICPRIPLTLRIAAPSNLATSNWELNIPWKCELPTITQEAKALSVTYVGHKNRIPTSISYKETGGAKYCLMSADHTKTPLSWL